MNAVVRHAAALVALAAALDGVSAQVGADILAAAPATAWTAIPADELLLVTTAKGTLVIRLAPAFAPAHVTAIKGLAQAGGFAGGAVVRVQDNYVVQFAARAGASPPGLKLPAEYERPAAGIKVTPLPGRDAYADRAGHADGWPVALDDGAKTAWLVHCYGMVGAGRGNPPDSGDGSELYAVIGHAPRHLDRNMATVGRVLAGLEPLAALPRGSEALGFYKTPAETLPISGAKLASDLPEAERPRFEVMDTASASFKAWAAARANRREPFFVRPAGAVDVCNAMPPVRTAAVR